MKQPWHDITVKEARKIILRERLLFADPRHIFLTELVANADKAIQLIREDKTDAMEPCDICDGTGDHECECGHLHRCENCDGYGELDDIISTSTVETLTASGVQSVLDQEVV